MTNRCRSSHSSQKKDLDNPQERSNPILRKEERVIRRKLFPACKTLKLLKSFFFLFFFFFFFFNEPFYSTHSTLWANLANRCYSSQKKKRRAISYCPLIRQSACMNAWFYLCLDHSIYHGKNTAYSTETTAYIEDIQMFGVNMTFISSSEVKQCLFHECRRHE